MVMLMNGVEMVEWRFEEKKRSQKSREPMQASFFTNASIDNDTHALIREAIQNSLDAKVDKNSPEPVKVRFSLGCHDINSGIMDKYISNEAWNHFNAPDNGLQNPKTKDDKCHYLTFEDFNTTGLIGNELASEPEPGNSFYYFMRAEGQSGKEAGDLGRHGIGKYVFPYNSQIRMFIMATVRSSDKRCLIAGQSVLKSHKVEFEKKEKHYTPDAWWGTFEDDGFQLPVEDKNLLNHLKNDFDVSRTAEDTGLTIVIPYINEEIKLEKILENIISEYFYPILKGQLFVELKENDEHKIIDKNSLVNVVDNVVSKNKINNLKAYINLANHSLVSESLEIIELNLPEKPALPVWDKEYLDQNAATKFNEVMDNENKIIKIRAPIYVQNNKTKIAQESFFDIYIAREQDEIPRKPFFIREGIRIPEDRVPNVHGYSCIIVIEEGPLATLLGDSENPAHTEWEKNATKFKGKYTWGSKTIDFVRMSVSRLFKLLNQIDEEDDRNVLADIFYINLPENNDDVPESRKKKKKNKKTDDGETNHDEVGIKAKPQYYQLSKIKGGFHLVGPKISLGSKRKYVVTVAYDVFRASKTNALKSYHKNDFNLSSLEKDNLIEIQNLEECDINGQKIEFVTDNNNFEIKVIGFDQRRDIIVDVKSKELVSETI